MTEILISNAYGMMTFDNNVYKPSVHSYNNHTVSSKKILKIGPIISNSRKHIYTKIGISDTFSYINSMLSKENLTEALRTQVNFKQNRKVFDFDIASFELIERILHNAEALSKSEAGVLTSFIQYGFPQEEDDFQRLYYVWDEKCHNDASLMLDFLSVIMSRYEQMLPFSMVQEIMKLMQKEDVLGDVEPYIELVDHTTPRDLIRRIVENSVEDEGFANLPPAWQIELLSNKNVSSVEDVASDETLENKVRQC